jgi:catechol 2,3-dioxygenase-like lactoylglutathione lyase family enzyme
MLVDGVSAILLISPNAKALAQFYRDALDLPLVDEMLEGVPLHYTCQIGGVHFAIHPSEGWPGVPTRDAQSPVIALRTPDARAVAERLAARGFKAAGPYDHGFAQVVTFRDPDGNHVEILEPAQRA